MRPLTIPQLLSGLRAKGISASAADGVINLKGAVEALTAGERQLLDERRGDLLLYFAAHAAVRQPGLKPSGADPAPAESQQSWWGWVMEAPFTLPHERISTINLHQNTSTKLVEAAVRKIIARHDTLRSVCRADNGKLVITLNAAEDFPVEVENLDASLGDAAAEALAKAQAKEFVSGDLPVDGNWLIKVKLIGWSSNVVVALLINHILVDGISVDLIRLELEGMLSGKASAERPSQFTDYAQWEQDWIHSESSLPLFDYWAHWLDGQAALRTPEGRVLEWQQGRNVNCHFTLSPSVRAKINVRATDLKTSPFFLYLALYSVALARWSGQDRFPLRCIGDLRRSRPLASVVGFMTCADPIEVQVPQDGDFAALLKFITAEYYNAAMLRLPSMLKFPAHPARPGIENRRYTEEIAATINFMPDRKRPSSSRKLESVAEVWPPSVQRAAPEDWPALLWPIYLRLTDGADRTQGLLQFNEAIVTPAEQTALLSHFFDAIAGLVGQPLKS